MSFRPETELGIWSKGMRKYRLAGPLKNEWEKVSPKGFVTAHQLGQECLWNWFEPAHFDIYVFSYEAGVFRWTSFAWAYYSR